MDCVDGPSSLCFLLSEKTKIILNSKSTTFVRRRTQDPLALQLGGCSPITNNG